MVIDKCLLTEWGRAGWKSTCIWLSVRTHITHYAWSRPWSRPWSWPWGKYFPIQPSRSVNKYIVLTPTQISVYIFTGSRVYCLSGHWIDKVSDWLIVNNFMWNLGGTLMLKQFQTHTVSLYCGPFYVSQKILKKCTLTAKTKLQWTTNFSNPHYFLNHPKILFTLPSRTL